jgi:hypothetical protein
MSIIFTQNFVLGAAATATPLTHARIGHQTWTRDLAVTAVTVSSETADGPGDAPLRPDTYEFWEAQSLPATWQVDLGAARDVDYVGIAGHTIGTKGASVVVEWSTDAANWTEFATGTAPATDAPILFLGESVFARHWRLTVDGVDSPGDPPQIAVVYIGEVLAMQRMIYGGHAPLPLARDTVLKRALSRGGRFLGQNIRRMGVTGDAAFQNLEPDWVREHFDPFVKAARQYPFFFAWRPAIFPREVAYAWATQDIAPANMGRGAGLMQVSWAMRGIGYTE